MFTIHFLYLNERKSEQVHIPQTPRLLDNAAPNEWQCHALAMGNWIENHKQISVIIGYTSLIDNCDTFFVKYQSSLSKTYLIEKLLCHSC